jgi:hypothetical protein
MATEGHSRRESYRDLSRLWDDVRRCQRAGRWIYPKWAGSLHLGAAARNGSDILGVGTESLGVSEYQVFDLKHRSLSSKTPLLYR